VVPPAHVPEAVPDMPVLSNRAVGADIPPVAPLVPAIEVPGLEFPGRKSSVALMLQYWNTYQLSWSREPTFLLPSG